MTFQIHALPREGFEPLFALSNDQLAAHKATWMTVEACPGIPCRISLEDAQVGEDVILVNHQHQSADSPYQSSHAVFVRRQANQANPAAGEVPNLFRHRLISVRAFDCDHMMVDADAVEGSELEQAIDTMFALPGVDYLHLHYAKAGCFAARVTRT